MNIVNLLTWFNIVCLMIFQSEVLMVEIGILQPEKTGQPDDPDTWFLTAGTTVWLWFDLFLLPTCANHCQPSMTFFFQIQSTWQLEPACKSCQIIMSTKEFCSETWPQMTVLCFARKIPQPFFAKFLECFRSRQWLSCWSWAYWALWSRLKLWKMRSGTNGAWSRASWRPTFQFQILCDNGEVI